MSAIKDEKSQNVNDVELDITKIQNLVDAVGPSRQHTLQAPESPQWKLSAFRPYIGDIHSGHRHTKRPKLDDNFCDDGCESVDRVSHLVPELAQHRECSAFGHSVAAQLMQMTKTQKVLAQRLISEVCFMGQIQVLQMGTVLTYPSVFQQQPQPVLPVYSTCPTNFTTTNSSSRGYVSVHNQQNLRQQPHMAPLTVDSTTAAPSPQYHNSTSGACGDIMSHEPSRFIMTPVTVGTATAAPQYQNYTHISQQPEHLVPGATNPHDISSK